jgi:hypothetical protein
MRDDDEGEKREVTSEAGIYICVCFVPEVERNIYLKSALLKQSKLGLNQRALFCLPGMEARMKDEVLRFDSRCSFKRTKSFPQKNPGKNVAHFAGQDSFWGYTTSMTKLAGQK